MMYRVRTAERAARYFTTDASASASASKAADYRDLEVGRRVVAATYVDDDTIALASADGSGSTVDRVALGGSGVLAISDNILSRWSPGDATPTQLAVGVQNAAWLPASGARGGNVDACRDPRGLPGRSSGPEGSPAPGGRLGEEPAGGEARR